MLLVITLLFALLTVFLILFPVVEIDGTSMCPTFEDKDKLRCTRIFKKLEIGSIYVYKRMEEGEEYLVVKRLSNISKQGDITYCYFLGDNSEHSLDSRHYGWIDSRNIIAKVYERR